MGLVSVCLGGVFLIPHNRQKNLASDLDTQRTKIALVANSEMLLGDFNSPDECPAPELCMELWIYKLGIWGGGGGYQLDAVGGRDNPPVQNLHVSCLVLQDSNLVCLIELSIQTRLTVALGTSPY